MESLIIINIYIGKNTEWEYIRNSLGNTWYIYNESDSKCMCRNTAIQNLGVNPIETESHKVTHAQKNAPK